MRGKKCSEETISWLREFYPKNGPLFCAEKLNLSKGAIKALTHAYKIRYLGTSRYGYTYNLNLDNKVLIYLLGYFWADGCLSVHKRSKHFQFAIQEKDGLVVEPLFNKIGPENLFHKRYFASKIKNREFIVSTRNMEFCSFLDKYDFNAKSFCEPEKLLSDLSCDMVRYFWRGFFDGDGSINVSSKRQIRISFAGQAEYKWTCLMKLLIQLNITFKIQVSTDKRGGRRSSLYFWRRYDVEKFFNYIYPDGYDFGLKRKFDRFILPPSPKGYFERPHRIIKNCSFIE